MFFNSDFPAADINRSKMLLKNYFNKRAAEFGLSAPHVPYVVLISKSKESITQQEASKILGYDKANSSRVVAELEAKGIIEKVAEAKRAVIKLTEQGEEVAVKVREAVKNWNKLCFDGINKQDMEAFNRVQKRMFENCMKAIEENL